MPLGSPSCLKGPSQASQLCHSNSRLLRDASPSPPCFHQFSTLWLKFPETPTPSVYVCVHSKHIWAHVRAHVRVGAHMLAHGSQRTNLGVSLINVVYFPWENLTKLSVSTRHLPTTASPVQKYEPLGLVFLLPSFLPSFPWVLGNKLRFLRS